MPSMLVSNISIQIAGAAALDLQPAAGQAWVLREFASDVVHVGFQPDIAVGILDAPVVHTVANIIQDPTDRADKGGRPKEIYITNANHAQITNTGANAYIGYTGERVDPNKVITDMDTCPTAGLGYVDIIPPAGETWRITEFGADTYDAGTDNPEVTVGIINAAGTLVASAIILEAADRGQNKALDWIIDSNIYLRVTNTTAAADVDIAWCGVRIAEASIGSVQDVVGSAVLDIQPPAGQEWVITEIAAQTWTGVPGPADVPNITVSLYDATNLSDILEPVASQAWNRKLHIHIDNDTYLRITEESTANNEVGILGYLKRSYS